MPLVRSSAITPASAAYTGMLPSLETLLDLVAERVAARVLAVLGAAKPSRVLLADVAAHGAPSRRWVEDQARVGRIAIHGPRGGRYVDAGELAALLASTTIRRRDRALPAAEEPIDASAVVLELARRRGA